MDSRFGRQAWTPMWVRSVWASPCIDVPIDSDCVTTTRELRQRGHLCGSRCQRGLPYCRAAPTQFRCTVVSAPGEPHVSNSTASNVAKFGEKRPFKVLLLKRHDGSRKLPTFDDEAMKSRPLRVPENVAC